MPLFPYFASASGENTFSIILSDHVTTEEGTGIVHIAPAFGEDDFQLGKSFNLPILDPVDAEGNFSYQLKLSDGQNIIEVIASKKLSPKSKVTKIVRLSR